MRRRIVLGADVDLPGEVADFVAELADLAGLAGRAAHRLRLAVDELTTNVAWHGYRGAAGLVDLSGGVDEGGVWLAVEDDAPPFDPTGPGPVEQIGSAEALSRPGGLGLLLVRQLVDGFSHAVVRGRNRTVVVLAADHVSWRTHDRHDGPAGGRL